MATTRPDPRIGRAHSDQVPIGYLCGGYDFFGGHLQCAVGVPHSMDQTAFFPEPGTMTGPDSPPFIHRWGNREGDRL